LGINVEYRDESGASLSSVHDPRMILPRLLSRVDTADSVCLRFIDPYGDAVFNYLQAPVLVYELKKVACHCETDEERRHIGRILHLAKRCASDRHRYLSFEGD
jgi:hypothetical protein